jgi:hypothetical protein
MKTILYPFRALHARRLMAALAVTCAAAAVGSAVVLSDRGAESDGQTQWAAAELSLEGRAVAEDTRSPAARSPNGASGRRAPLPTASKSMPPYRPGDSSLPLAGDVFGGSPGTADEAAPTF